MHGWFVHRGTLSRSGVIASSRHYFAARFQCRKEPLVVQSVFSPASPVHTLTHEHKSAVGHKSVMEQPPITDFFAPHGGEPMHPEEAVDDHFELGVSLPQRSQW